MKPRLDYYIGRPVEGVEQGSEGDWDWAIIFSGGYRVRNTDHRRTTPPSEIIGTHFFSVIMSEADTHLTFGHYERPSGDPITDHVVVLTPTQYAISDERFEGGPHFPQRLDDEEQELLPEDPSAERVADGPDEEWHAEQERVRQAEEEALERAESDSQATDE